MATQADVRRMVEQLQALQPAQPRIAPRSLLPPLEGDDLARERARQNILNDPFMRQWMEYRRPYDEKPAPFGNPNLKGPLPGELPADTEPYEDPWTGPTLAPKKRR